MKNYLLMTVLLCFAVVNLSFGQTRTITGTVTSAEDGEPLPAVSIQLKGTTTGAITELDGTYRINVPQDGGVLVFSFVGLTTKEVSIGNNTVIDVSLESDIQTLGEIVVTGVAAGTPEKKLSFTVGKLNEEIIQQAPAVNAAAALQGKIAGVRVVQSSQPGENASIQLRGASGISTDASEPLVVVDGVLTEGGLSIVNAQDIERIEVLKGASAASLFGSRAANGVIQIFTKTGASNAVGQTVIRIRNEYGGAQAYNSRAPQKIAVHHFLTNPDGTIQVNDTGVTFLGVADPRGIADKPFAEPTYDHLSQVFDGGTFMTNYVAISHNSGKSNLLTSVEHQDNSGPIMFNEGSQRFNFRVNLDHNVTDRLKVTARTLFARSSNDTKGLNNFGGTRAVLRTLFMMDPTADLFLPNDNGTPYKWNINKYNDTDGTNPLYGLSRVKRDGYTTRFLGNFGASYEVANGLTVEYAFGIDNDASNANRFLNKGHLDRSAGDSPLLGTVYRNWNEENAITSSTTLVYVKKFGDFNLRSRLFYMYENRFEKQFIAQGTALNVSGLNVLQNATVHSPPSSRSEEVTANNFAFAAGGDYLDKYIFDVIVRREAVSLFGADERWANFGRISTAYRLTEDIYIPGFQELALRASYGTSGRRPGFTAQYERFNVTGAGVVSSLGNLGNRNLKPATTAELELSINAEFLNKFTFSGGYSTQQNRDQILNIPITAATGFNNQVQNAGTLETNTIELTLGYNAIQTRDVSLDFNVVFDRSRQKITEFDRPAQLTGYTIWRPGATLGVIAGQKLATSLDEVANQVPAGQTLADYFTINRDGYVIRSGTEFTADERAIIIRDDSGAPLIQDIGDFNADFNMGINTTFRYKGLNVYMLWDTQVGGNTYFQGGQWMARDLIHPMFDQSMYPEGQQKYTAYFSGLYNVQNITSFWVEDSDYIRMRELALNYSVSESQLDKLGSFGFIKGVKFGVVGRNLLLFSKYPGFDPEVGNALTRVDDFNYPLTRTFSGSIEFIF
ncbi:SusC/RagA family TonB-linked outer membrane protein [Peijinzhouia sedimentorum]